MSEKEEAEESSSPQEDGKTSNSPEISNVEDLSSSEDSKVNQSFPENLSEDTSHSQTTGLLKSPYFIGIISGLIYGLLNRMIVFNPEMNKFTGGEETVASVFILTTFGFVFLIPFAMGYLSISTRKQPFKNNLEKFLTAVFLPWIPTLLGLLAATLSGFEAMVCIIMATPVFLFMASIGGLVGTSTINGSKKFNQFLLAGILVLPHSVSAIESKIPLQSSTQLVNNSIVIKSDIATVWKNIERVPLIKEHEQSSSFLHLIGFPRPLEATLSHQGIGGVRHASFEDNVLFIETVTEWNYHKSLAFTIKPEVKNSTSEFLNTKILGGRYFNVLNGRYEIEPLKDGKVKLHLSSQHQVSTHYNLYAALWTRYIMGDLQQYILDIIKKRCES